MTNILHFLALQPPSALASDLNSGYTELCLYNACIGYCSVGDADTGDVLDGPNRDGSPDTGNCGCALPYPVPPAPGASPAGQWRSDASHK